MLDKIGLEGNWKLQLDKHKQGLQLPYEDSIELPNTTSNARKGEKLDSIQIGALTDEYAFEGSAWYAREVEIPEEFGGKTCVLFLERTRITTLWIDGREIGTQNSLSTPHRYELHDGLSAGRHEIILRVDNTGYPSKGGHLTSGDTQTNWNGITGRIELQFYGEAFMNNVRIYPDLPKRSFKITGNIVGDWAKTALTITAESFNGEIKHEAPVQLFELSSNVVSVNYELGENALLWSDAQPNLYTLNIRLKRESGEVLDVQELIAGLREFKTNRDKFTINGANTLLRGKHDGLIFPLTGYAPTEVDEWLRIMGISKSYGINHYRFHTCCPPEAAFIAADILGIYMAPELPFWGTVTDETYEKHDQVEQDYLISEGYAMLEAYGNHPSFVIMSLGNELWGSKVRLDDILKAYKLIDDRHLYTQGSNNFQFAPDILTNDDFFCGVRFSKDRLIRGSYAMCDSPQGHIQTDRPNTMKDYDDMIVPQQISFNDMENGSGATIQIQYGTGVKTVEANNTGSELIPQVPVISHEIGQFAMYPNFEEISKYKGSLKAKNFEEFRNRLEAKGLGHLAEKYFYCSGKLAVECYKEELEAAFRSKRLAGFQLLDIQDFSGQGTALVGILDAFMDSKGLITPEEWRSFCGDAVLLARFEKYNYQSGEVLQAQVELSYYRDHSPNGLIMQWELRDGVTLIGEGEAIISVKSSDNYIEICEIRMQLPSVTSMTKVTLHLKVDQAGLSKTYDFWIYPENAVLDVSDIHLFHSLDEKAVTLLEKGENVLLLAKPDGLSGTVPGTYCTDFWCYPMFRSISESMNKPVPVGTMGLMIDKDHALFNHFLTEEYTTYPWWEIVTHSSSVILDDLPQSLQPIVQTIDNFERNHKLGLLFEARVLNGSVLMCAIDYENIVATLEGRQLLFSMISYLKSETFAPQTEINLDQLQAIFS
ncbi:glycoside hydrolase family 2 TIM barrel-domain containing protein [Paenibacillus oryzisoli]|uniref:beta-galactosidase n=1 Tax=Paenibacillus oryzisoli TaxID=1850517 RepID=A0A198ALR0_9BACL|nr:glycoside hydrolase family 2 TIM barrel-domain containing protein [Paenibacillus oryzisoli]OAS21848.1 beta-glucuronidase [Paenibacillus oryzisoli]